MFSIEQIKGSRFPGKTLSLTFDDGPVESGVTAGAYGPSTLQLAEYLHKEGVPATFFMVGRFIAQYPAVMPEVVKLGHLIGNHTYNHPDMQRLFEAGGDVRAEIRRTDDLIAHWTPGSTVYFRAPFGSWSPQLSATLNRDANPHFNYAGPVHWDIECGDWAYWRDGRSAVECAEAYWKEIKKVKRGIVLMHDSSADIDPAKTNNQTLETIKILVPRLKRKGYRFVRLDAMLSN